MPSSAPEPIHRRQIMVTGIVQGVGFRPFVYNRAVAQSLSGWVRNESGQVVIEAAGRRAALDRFVAQLRHEAPPAARVDEIRVIELGVASCGEPPATGFTIIDSCPDTAPRPVIPPDLAVCPACAAEVLTPGMRRHRYAFTNCTHCGPRWSIIEGLPYDRPRTSMRPFAMCAACHAEYNDPGDRRFHAQPIACAACGPRLRWEGWRLLPGVTDKLALERAASVLEMGGIVALKGIGGFQLLCDATQSSAVQLLRQRKRRPDKPLALLVADLESARRLCAVTAREAGELVSSAAPILLLPRRGTIARGEDVTQDVADDVAPGHEELGVMLPASPLHLLLSRRAARPLVCTSGNLSDEPIAIDDDEARQRLRHIADGMLTHDRGILRAVDDSVVRCTGRRRQVLRRARGFAPAPITTPHAAERILAVGAGMKNSVGLGLGTSLVLSPHIGDLENALTARLFRKTIDDLLQFFDCVPRGIVCDLHPDYASTVHAERLADRWDVPLVRVQHHHAHVASCMVETGWEQPVLGLAWDGTGLGTDGTIWGSEALLCQAADFRRVAHLLPFPLPGGDRAARRPLLSALGLLSVLGDASVMPRLEERFAPEEWALLLRGLDRPGFFPVTTSMGRFLDGIAALLGLYPSTTYEAQAAIALERLARGACPRSDPPATDPDYRLHGPGHAQVGDWRPLLGSLLSDLDGGRPREEIAWQVHLALADWARNIVAATGCARVALSGGCFQNALLYEALSDWLETAGYELLAPPQIPPGDGGIAAGQLVLASFYFW